MRVNGKTIRKSSHPLEPGQTVELCGQLPMPSSDITPTDLRLEVLYEDAACIVINKPVDLSVHPGAGMEPGTVTVLHGIAHLFAARSLPFSMQMPLVHRLDKDTTGCLLVAKDPESHAALQAQFEHRTVQKTYLALVAGRPVLAEATIDSPIGRSTSNRTRMAVRGATKLREAQTTYRVLDATDQAALVECDLHTGRTHQIRVHLHAIGHPVLGDATYTTPTSVHLAGQFGIQSICLHAWRLSFISPHEDRRQTVQAPLPPTLAQAVAAAHLHFSA